MTAFYKKEVFIIDISSIKIHKIVLQSHIDIAGLRKYNISCLKTCYYKNKQISFLLIIILFLY
jgi:hypothetical protein